MPEVFYPVKALAVTCVTPPLAAPPTADMPIWTPILPAVLVIPAARAPPPAPIPPVKAPPRAPTAVCIHTYLWLNLSFLLIAYYIVATSPDSPAPNITPPANIPIGPVKIIKVPPPIAIAALPIP